MGFLKSTVKTSLAAAALDFARRQAAKPENRERAKVMAGRVQQRLSDRRRTAG
ncbi:MAG: hypothetical protein U0Q15_09425 [Kineosporiaceae bacterium]